MRILAIRGRNLASLEGEFALDFTAEPLASAGIFAISGPTGSGKSTLLDAMCLALFAKTPRTELAKERQVKLIDVNKDQLSQSDPRFLLRRGTASGYAEVDFIALNGHRYRSRWSVQRARDHEKGRLQAARISLTDLDSEQEEKGTLTELQNKIVDLIGLTFDQFTRSVLLAQNDFSTFLKAEQGEKALLLEKLTGTEMYSQISKTIHGKTSEVKEAYQQLNMQVQGVELLPEEEEVRFQALLRESEATFDRLEKERAEFQHLLEAVKTQEIQLESKRSKQKNLSIDLEQANKSLAESETMKAKVDSDLEKESKQSDWLQKQLLKAREIDAEIQHVALAKSDGEKRLKNVDSQKKKTEEDLNSIDTMLKKAIENQTKLEAYRETYKKKEGIADHFSVLKIHLDDCLKSRTNMKGLERVIADFNKDIQVAEKGQKASQSRLKDLLDKQAKVLKEQQAIEKIVNAIDPLQLEKQRADLNTKRESLLMEQARFMATGTVKELRDKLIEDQPCPVCGSTIHPYTTHKTATRLLNLTVEISDVTIKLQGINEQKAKFENLQKQYSDLQKRELELHREESEVKNQLSGFVNQIRVWSERIEREKVEINTLQEKLSSSLDAVNDIFGHDAWQVNWHEDPNGFMLKLETFVRQWQANKDQLAIVERERSLLSVQKESLGKILLSQTQDYEKELSSYREKQHYYDSVIAKRKDYFDGAQADEVEKSFHEKLELLQKKVKDLQENMTQQMRRVAECRGSLEQLNTDIKDLTELLEKSKQAVSNWQISFQEKSEGKTLEDWIAAVNTQKTNTQYQLRKNEENKKKIAGLQKELEKRRAVCDQWTRLDDLVGSADGGKFRRIVQGYTLDLLLNYANVQLRSLTRRYRLERVPETLALQVIDQDMCDEVRTVHSLSGGESFLVSLALALGLSSLSSNRMKVESLFIDEGFGSLDAETLRVAMDALESLRTQGRKIGVISHVQEMTERIPVQVRVNRVGNGRSFIEVL